MRHLVAVQEKSLLLVYEDHRISLVWTWPNAIRRFEILGSIEFGEWNNAVHSNWLSSNCRIVLYCISWNEFFLPKRLVFRVWDADFLFLFLIRFISHSLFENFNCATSTLIDRLVFRDTGCGQNKEPLHILRYRAEPFGSKTGMHRYMFFKLFVWLYVICLWEIISKNVRAKYLTALMSQNCTTRM